jgi:hypothetical protein
VICLCCGISNDTTTIGCARCAWGTFCGACGVKVSCGCGAQLPHVSERCPPVSRGPRFVVPSTTNINVTNEPATFRVRYDVVLPTLGGTLG